MRRVPEGSAQAVAEVAKDIAIASTIGRSIGMPCRQLIPVLLAYLLMRPSINLDFVSAKYTLHLFVVSVFVSRLTAGCVPHTDIKCTASVIANFLQDNLISLPNCTEPNVGKKLLLRQSHTAIQ